MGTFGREIVGERVDEVIDLLNKAYCDEWLAYYQYWVGAKLVVGPMRDADPITSNLTLRIFEDEVEHEEELQALLVDIRAMLSHHR